MESNPFIDHAFNMIVSLKLSARVQPTLLLTKIGGLRKSFRFARIGDLTLLLRSLAARIVVIDFRIPCRSSNIRTANFKVHSIIEFLCDFCCQATSQWEVPAKNRKTIVHNLHELATLTACYFPTKTLQKSLKIFSLVFQL